MSGAFQWDEDKAERNLRLHGVPFTEAVKVFDDNLRLRSTTQNTPAKTKRDLRGLA